MQEYCNMGLSKPEASKHTPTVRTIIKGFLDNPIKQRCESSLEAAKTVEELYEILEDQEEIFWPQEIRMKSFMKTTRKSSEDPLTFLLELQKKSKFCRVYTVIDGVECNKCHEKVNVNPNDKSAVEKYVLQVFYKGVNHNEFLP